MTEALQRQLANDEPKCANCISWAPPPGHIRLCRRFTGQHYTTDLSVCSQWQPKEKTDAQTEAEAQ